MTGAERALRAPHWPGARWPVMEPVSSCRVVRADRLGIAPRAGLELAALSARQPGPLRTAGTPRRAGLRAG